MARRRRDDLDDLFELWARWLSGPGGFFMPPATGATPLAKWCEGQGHVVFGGGGEAPTDSVEERIEAAVFSLASRDELTATVLRHEYGVWGASGRWRDARDPRARQLTQADKADALGVSLRTYRRRLALGRQQVKEALGGEA